jgi:hypothetical protein
VNTEQIHAESDAEQEPSGISQLQAPEVVTQGSVPAGVGAGGAGVGVVLVVTKDRVVLSPMLYQYGSNVNIINKGFTAE